MLGEWMNLALVVGAIALALFPIFLLLLRRRPEVEVASDGEEQEVAPGVLGALTGPVGAQIPLTRTGQDELQKLLLGAGYYQPNSLMNYRAIRTVLTIAPLFLTAAAALLAPPELMNRALFGGLIASLMGFSLPRVVLALRRRARAREISRGLPLAIDLLTLCLTAGQNLNSAFFQVAQEVEFSHPVLAQELRITQRQIELHSVEVAMQQWADRVQVPDVSNLSMLLIQSERLGTDTSLTLTELANNFRTTARQRAETQANKTSFWMLFPSVFCFWIAAAIILIGPAYLAFFEYRQQAGQRLNDQTRRNIERANQRPRPMPTDPNSPGSASPGGV